ncbi:hypothetical protein BH23GEM9_BH23GEM9_24180 [soil metagenome]
MHCHRRTFILAALVVLFTGGCATTPDPTTGEVMSVEFRIENNLPGIGGVSAYLVVADAGSRQLLGPIESNRTGTYQRTVRTGTYSLVIGRVGASDIVSDRFRLDTDIAVIAWNVSANQLTFGQR